jgi:hypothetical protein
LWNVARYMASTTKVTSQAQTHASYGNARTKRFSTSQHGYMRRQVERDNAKAELGIVVAKRRGYGNPSDQYAVLRLEDLLTILKKAGY